MNNIYKNLELQLTKLYRHNRQGSFKTKERYYEAMKRFCHFLAEKYRLEKLANIAPKHIFAYVDYMKEKNLSASTIKTDLAAIRFYHDMVANPRYPKLPDNRELKLARRSFGKVDRSWSEREFSGMVQIAIEGDRQDYVAIFHLARHVGLRIHECFRIDTAIARQAVNTGKIVIKGKGGKVRSVPIFSNTVNILNKLLLSTEPGHKLFVPKDMPTHIAINRLQQFIITHRSKVMDGDAPIPITLHGLRHSYAVEQYKESVDEGHSDFVAKRTTSRLLGHNRADVTNIYLTSLKEGDDDA